MCKKPRSLHHCIIQKQTWMYFLFFHLPIYLLCSLQCCSNIIYNNAVCFSSTIMDSINQKSDFLKEIPHQQFILFFLSSFGSFPSYSLPLLVVVWLKWPFSSTENTQALLYRMMEYLFDWLFISYCLIYALLVFSLTGCCRKNLIKLQWI